MITKTGNVSSAEDDSHSSFQAINRHMEATNMCLVGSNADREAREAAAKTEPQWLGIGQKDVLTIWQIDGPNVKSWPRYKYSQFCTQDCYLVLRSRKIRSKINNSDQVLMVNNNPLRNSLKHDLHLWVGKESSGVIQGIAAYKMVEANTSLERKAIQHREEQGKESKLFLSYFGNRIQTLEPLLLQSHVQNVMNQTNSIKKHRGKQSKRIHRLMRVLAHEDLDISLDASLETSFDHISIDDQQIKDKNIDENSNPREELKSSMFETQHVNSNKSSMIIRENIGQKRFFSKTQNSFNIGDSQTSNIQLKKDLIVTHIKRAHDIKSSMDQPNTAITSSAFGDETYKKSSQPMQQSVQANMYIKDRQEDNKIKESKITTNSRSGQFGRLLIQLRSSPGTKLEEIAKVHLQRHGNSMQWKKLDKSLLDSRSGYIFDCGSNLYVWLGRSCSQYQRKFAKDQVWNYLKRKKRSHVPFTFIEEGQLNEGFESYFQYSKNANRSESRTPCCVKNPGNNILRYLEACQMPSSKREKN